MLPKRPPEPKVTGADANPYTAADPLIAPKPPWLPPPPEFEDAAVPVLPLNPPPFVERTPLTVNEPDEKKEELPVHDIVHVLPIVKETPARNSPEAAYQTDDVLNATVLLAARETPELKLTVLLVTKKSLKVQKKLLGEFIVDEERARLARHALPLVFPKVLAVDDTVAVVPEMVRYATEPSTPAQYTGVTMVETIGSHSVAPEFIVVEEMWDVSRGLLV